MSFAYVDLFAGIGGFHAALSALGGDCALASEIDPSSAAVYRANWMPAGQPGRRPKFMPDVQALGEHPAKVPSHAVLTAGFPCQPFSKSGQQRGIDETRGTLFWDILKILEARRPAVVFMENVRNLAGPRHRDTWDTIVHQLRELGYKLSSEPTVMSPHLLPPELGGSPQVRDRVFIFAVQVGRDRALAETEDAPLVTRAAVGGWAAASWRVISDLPMEAPTSPAALGARLGREEETVIHMWDHFSKSLRLASGGRLPGFPFWSDWFVGRPRIPRETPEWKRTIIRKNLDFYEEYQTVIDDWKRAWPGLASLAASHRKFEWQAQDALSIWDCAIQFRPSGVRCKLPTYLPALVAMNQTSVIGPLRRRITVREAARLQGFPETFDFGTQSDAKSFRQLGNAVQPRLAYWLLRTHVLAQAQDVGRRAPELVKACEVAAVAMPGSPAASGAIAV